MHSLLLHELLRSEIETSQQGKLISELIKQGISFPQLITLFEEKTLARVYTRIATLHQLPPEQLAHNFIQVKRAILDALGWIKLCESYYQEHLFTPLGDGDKGYLQDTLKKLKKQTDHIDIFIPQVLAVRKEFLTRDYHHNRQLLIHKIQQILSEELHVDTVDLPANQAESQAKVQHVLHTFLSQQQQTFKHIADYADTHRQRWEEEVITSGRSILITVPDLFPFPVIYSVKGTLYVIMEIPSHYIGAGKEKIASRSANFSTGNLEALLRPKTFFPDLVNPEEASVKMTEAFWDTWRDADMLAQLHHKRGILQVYERFVFEVEGRKSLYLFQEYYRNQGLNTYLGANRGPKKRLSLSQKHKLTLDMLHGLTHIHAEQIIHHDIKPNNILITLGEEEKAAISDFHIACYTYDKIIKNFARVVPKWCAPEYAAVEKDLQSLPEAFVNVATQKMDVWAMGMVLFILFYEQPPPWNHLTEDAQVLEAVSSLQSGWLAQYVDKNRYFPLLEKMLEVNPVQRCTAAEALALFQQIITED